MYPVTLRGSRIKLREFQADNLDATLRYASDPEVMGWTGGGLAYHRDIEQQYLENLLRLAERAKPLRISPRYGPHQKPRDDRSRPSQRRRS
jgi:hypothetical protein